jgi:hypothetical protein
MTNNENTIYIGTSYFSDGKPVPLLMTEEELIKLLRVPELSKSKNYHNVIENLKRFRDIPRVHICGKTLFPLTAILRWVKQETTYKK